MRPRGTFRLPIPSTSPKTLAFNSSIKFRHSRYPHTPMLVREIVSRLNYGSLALRPVALLALLSELTRFVSSHRGRLLPGFRRVGHPRRRRVSLQSQLVNFHSRDLHPLNDTPPFLPTPSHI